MSDLIFPFSLFKRLSVGVILLLAAARLTAQEPTITPSPCTRGQDPEPDSGPPKTLCYRYSNPALPLPPVFVIGSPGRQFSSQVTAILGTNHITGHVQVVGDFTIDDDFTFQDCYVPISPNVKITIRDLKTLTLDNAKLFCCTGMWQGILLDAKARIETQSITEIEDAWNAIDVPCGSVDLRMRISHTIFNRNFVGIRVGHAGNTPFCVPPLLLYQMELFSGNTFSCTQSLNLPTPTLGFAGIHILRANLQVGNDFSFPSTFQHTRFGIRSEGGEDNTLLVSRCNFQGLRDEGIYQMGGVLRVRNSSFVNCFANGIRQDFTLDLNVHNCGFVMSDFSNGAPLDFHNGIFATRFGLGATVAVNESQFTISHDRENGISRGIYLHGGIQDVGAQSKVAISHNDFSVQTSECRGIFMEGDFTNLLGGSSSIESNGFTLFNHTDIGNHLHGIYLLGDFRHFSIWANHFFGLQRPLGPIMVNATTSIEFRGLGNSANNEIGNNTWHLPDDPPNVGELAAFDLFYSLRASDLDFTSICQNVFRNVVHAGSFDHLGSHTVYSNNEFAWIAHGPAIESGSMGIQEHQGNRWIFPSVTVNGVTYLGDINNIDGYHIRCSGPVTASRFFVHTPQATQLWDVLHPFHPFVIIPDMDDEFFEQQPGSPQECNLQGLTGEVPDMDKWVADGDTDALQGMEAAEIWRNQRSLYRLLQSDPSYYAAYSGFPGFVAQHQNGNVGKFYQIASLLAQSAEISTSVTSATLTQQQRLHDNIAEFVHLDSLLQVESDSVEVVALKAAQEDASEEIKAAQQHLDSLQAVYDSGKMAYYQQALSINSQVNATTVHEANEKTVNQVMLNALVNQDGAFTEPDIQLLRGVAAQCPKTGGTAVNKARSLLPDCDEDPAVNDDTAECMGLPSTHTEGNVYVLPSLPLGGNTPPSALVMDREVVLSLPFETGSRYALYDLNGRSLLAGQLDTSLRVQLPGDLSAGVYICSVTYSSGRVITQKVVLTR